MGKRNLLVDRSLVGVSKLERTSTIRWDDITSPKFALNHACLRTTYMSANDRARGPDYTEQDFFRGAMGRYWSFKDGDGPNTYADFGYLNQTQYHGSLEPDDLEILNTPNNINTNKIAFSIGRTPALATTIHPLTPDSTIPDLEWPIEEVGEVGIGDMAGALAAVLENDIVGGITDLLVKPWANLLPLWIYIGYPTSLGDASMSIPLAYHHTTGTGGGTGAGGLPPNGTREMNNLTRKKYLVVNSLNEVWVLASEEVPPNFADDDTNSITEPWSLTRAPLQGAKWDLFWGLHRRPAPPTLSPSPWIDNDDLTEYPGFLHQYVGNYNGFFKDHAYKFYTPYGANHPIHTTGAPTTVKVAKIEPKYNYFSKHYEIATSASNIDERLLPNSYMIYNYIDYKSAAAAKRFGGGDRIGDGVRRVLKRQSTLYNKFGMPSSRDQIAQLGYDSPKRSYLQKYSAELKAHGAPSGTKWLRYLNTHIGFSKDMMESDFVRYQDREDFPYGVAIEFDTIMTGLDVNTELIESLEGIPGATDFITNNLVLMNLNNWDAGATGGEGFNTYNESIDFSNQITEFIPEDQDPDTPGMQLGTVPTHTYYGFDWVDGGGALAPFMTWGGVPESESGLRPHRDRGLYNLRCLDVGRMLDYANLSRKVPRFPALSTEDSLLPNNEAPTTAATTPCALVGQIKYRGIARGRGILVGPKGMRQSTGTASEVGSYDSDRSSPKIVYDGADYKTVATPAAFQSILQAFENIIRKKSRSYLEMINGKLAYSETLAFKVCKHKVTGVDPNTGKALYDINNPLQTFYFPNVMALDKIKYFDTQVHYGVRYKYIIYAYNFVIGNQYCYENIELPGSPAVWPSGYNYTEVSHFGNIYAKSFYAHQFISAKIIETPYYEFDTVQVRDLPPVFPEIETVPFKGVNNRVRFLMQTQNVKYVFTPEKFMINEMEDRPRYDVQREYQQRPAVVNVDTGKVTGPPIIFGSDDTDITFEIYRMTEKPMSYADFAPHLHATMPGVLPSGRRATSMSFDDVIEPNTKYYYTFRCIDYHGGLSIPSPIYHLEIVDDNGRMFPIVNVFYISNHIDDSVVIKGVKKPFRKYLHIGAAFAQKLISADAGSPFETAALNPAALTGLQGLLGSSTHIGSEDGVWSPRLDGLGEYHASTNKKVFKVRIISKNTGKKLDLNVRLEEVPIINPEEQS